MKVEHAKYPELLKNAEAFRAQAEGLIRSAEALEAIASRFVLEVKNA